MFNPKTSAVLFAMAALAWLFAAVLPLLRGEPNHAYFAVAVMFGVLAVVYAKKAKPGASDAGEDKT